jgi:hypothetical protein
MAEPALHALQAALAQPWVWLPVTAIAAKLCRDTIRLLIFIWGLSIALRGAAGADRARILHAYATCSAVEPDRGDTSTRSAAGSPPPPWPPQSTGTTQPPQPSSR